MMWSWFSRKKAAEPTSGTSRSMSTLASGHSDEESADRMQEELAKLDRYLFGWLLDSDYHRLELTTESTTAIDREIAERLEGGNLQELPRQPMILPQLMRAIALPNVRRHEISEIMLADPALTDQLLQVVNSPFFRTTEQSIESVDQAIFMLGMDGIRSVIAAAVMRPMMAARSSSESLFARRTWRWGLACSRASELVAQAQNTDYHSLSVVGLLPALAYLTLYRELANTQRQAVPAPAVAYHVIVKYFWQTCQYIATEWQLSPRHHAILLHAQRPAPGSEHTPLNDGMILGTREVLRHAHQRNLPEDTLCELLQLPQSQFHQVRNRLVAMLKGEEAGTQSS